MQAMDYWRLCDEMSVVQAALLIVGENPANFQEWVDQWEPNKRPNGYDAVRTALTNAITSGRLKATIRYSAREYGYADQLSDIEYGEAEFTTTFGTTADDDEILSKDHSCFYKPFPDWTLTTILIVDLRDWLKSRGVTTGFFFSPVTDAPDYLDAEDPRYAPKLAAAVSAWCAVTDPNGKHPKQALIKWLREHAVQFGLTDDEGRPNETGIEEAAKVANWKPGGGAPKTPGQ